MAEIDTLDTMPPASFETEDQRRQRLAQLPPSNAMPPAPVGVNTDLSKAPIGTTSLQSMPPMPLGETAEPKPNPNVMPAAPVPQRPELHGWREALDVLGGLTPLGRQIETAIPGTPQNFDWRQAMEAARGEKQAGTERIKQETAESKSKQGISEQESKLVPVPDHPEMGLVEQKNLPAILRTLATGESRENVAETNQAGATTREQMKLDAKPAVANGLKFGVLKPDIVAQIGPMPEDAEGQKKWGEEYDKLAGKGKQTGLGSLAMVRLLDYFQKYNPEGLQMMPQILKQAGIEMPAGTNVPAIPPGQPTDENGKPIGSAQPGAPTSSTRSQGQMAEKVLDRLPDIRKEVNDLKGYLGPGKGRLNVAYLLGKVGTTGDDKKDRDLSRLRSDLALMATAGARFHINSVQAMEEMENLANAGKDSAPALNGAIDSIEKWANDAANQGRGRPPHQSAAGAASATGGFAAWKKAQGQ